MNPVLFGKRGTAREVGTSVPSSPNWLTGTAGYNPAQVMEHDVTQLLTEWKQGSNDARDRLIPLLYNDLRRVADRYLRGESGAATLQPTALVHEAYVRLVQQKLPDFRSRAHFLGVAAHVMRQLLVENARHHKRQKRGGGAVNLPLDEALSFAPQASSIVVDLDDALRALATVDERKSRIIELRFFGGLTIEETADVMELSTATVGRKQRTAEAWLYRKMQGRTN